MFKFFFCTVKACVDEQRGEREAHAACCHMHVGWVGERRCGVKEERLGRDKLAGVSQGNLLPAPAMSLFFSTSQSHAPGRWGCVGRNGQQDWKCVRVKVGPRRHVS